MEIYPRTKSANLRFLLIVVLLLASTLAGCGGNMEERALNGDALHEVWQQTVGGAINHPPLPVGNILIVASVESPLVGLDIETGKVRWEYDPGVRIWDRAYASDGKRVFIGMDGGRLAALNASNGKVLWEATLGINAQVPLLVTDGVVYAATTFAGPGMIGDPTGKAKLSALSAKDGSILWEFESGNYILQTPFKQGGTIYLAGSFSDEQDVDEGGHMRLYALDALDGSVKWQYESQDGFTKQVYATERMVAYIAYRDFAIGVDAATGEPRWSRDTGNWVPTLLGEGNVVYFGSANTLVHALDMDTGTPVWEYNIPEGTFNYVLGAPVRVADDLIFLTQQGELFSLDAGTGELRWLISTDIAGARTGPSVSGGWMFIGDADGIVHGFTDQ